MSNFFLGLSSQERWERHKNFERIRFDVQVSWQWHRLCDEKRLETFMSVKRHTSIQPDTKIAVILTIFFQNKIQESTYLFQRLLLKCKMKSFWIFPKLGLKENQQDRFDSPSTNKRYELSSLAPPY